MRGALSYQTELSRSEVVFGALWWTLKLILLTLLEC
jgi:hypothetical protein